MKNLVSIILPFTNCSAYIIDCVESIINQSEKNWELIAVNDHSTDSSKAIMDDYSRSDSRIKVFNNPGTGIIEALKTGYLKSEGEIIHRMDSDDIMPPNKLKTLKGLLEKSGGGHVITGKVKYFSETTISKGYQDYENWLNFLSGENRHWDEIYKECVISSPAWMIYRKDFDMCGAFDSKLYPEDYDLVFRFYKNNIRVISTDSVIHLWREHSDRTSRNSQNYQQEAFYRLKTEYWLKIEKVAERPIALVGSGIKNKLLTRILDDDHYKSYSFNDNTRSSKTHFEHWLKDSLQTKNPAQFLITIADQDVKNDIKSIMVQHQQMENQDFYFFS